MALFGGKKSPSYIGVDIGASGIKLVELANEKGRGKLLTYGYSEQTLDEGATPFDDPKATAAVLADICKQAGTTSVRAVSGLPSSQLFSTIVAVPRRKDEREMRPLIDAQVAKVTPLPLSEMVVYSTFIDDIKPLPQQAKGGSPVPARSEYVRVLVTGGAKTLIQKYIEIFKLAKLNLVAIDAEPFALIRALIGKDRTAVALVDIGFKRTNIVIVENGIPFLTRSINIGGFSVTKRVMDAAGLSQADAEQMKRDLGSSGNNGSLPPAIESVIQPIVNEVRYAFQLYANMETTDVKKVEKVIITGGSAHLPRIPEHMAAQLNVNVYRGDPWARVVYPVELRPVLDDIGPRMGVAIGLAMRDIE